MAFDSVGGLRHEETDCDHAVRPAVGWVHKFFCSRAIGFDRKLIQRCWHPVPLDLTVGPGEKLVLQLDTPLHTGSTRHGDRAYFKTSDEVMAGGVVAIPRGSEVRATVTHVRRPGRLAGRAEMRLRFDDVRLPDGTILPLEASVVRAGYTDIKTSKEGDQALKGDGGNGSSLTIVGQGGMQGAILGATLGGGKGALYGGAAGAAIGLATIMMQRGPDLDLPRDMLFELKFDKAFQVPAAIAQRAAQIARSVPVGTSGEFDGKLSRPGWQFSRGSQRCPSTRFQQRQRTGASSG